MTLSELSTQEQWWLNSSFPLHVDNSDTSILFLLKSKGLLREKKDFMTNKPVFYLTQEGERLRKQLKGD